MKNVFVQLVSFANELDKKGLYSYADRIDAMLRLAIYTLPPDPFEGTDTKLTPEQTNDIMDRWNAANGGDDVDVQVLEGDKIVLRFPSGSDVELSGDDWDRLQVALGIM